ncbi:MAG: Holliday junction branch migration protein RuvA [Ruminococcaceae bacterium]|jgi:Holliday junction DNA helicase RuvA|nr:Holliday junction branch migration protein RuvA [Oscillospiraceae bacterium]
MFYYVKGKVAVCEPGLVVIDAGGVGYAVQTSATSASQVQPGDNATFYTYLHVREDIFDLYGFITRDELDCFKLLLGISGVGPKAALSILSVTNPASLALAVLTDDQKALSAAPGVGKKLAQRIILELKDRMSKGQLESAASVGETMGVLPESGTAADDAIAALMVLGYSRAEATTALKGADLTGLSVDEIVRIALKKLF